MEEEKEVIESEKIIDNEEDTIDELNEDESDEEIEEDETDELEEDSEMDKTRKIDFSNKNEVYQDFFDEKKKSKLAIVIIVIFVLLLIGVICYLVYINRDKIFNKIDNVVDNMDSLVDVENSDNDNSGDVVTSTSSDDVEEKVLNIYQKDSENVVVFTYKCKSTDCDIEVTKDGFILYDEEKVYHRDMTAYELEQINNTDKTPAKSELSFSGFEEVKSLFDNKEPVDVGSSSFGDLSVLYEMDSIIYIINNDEILSLDNYNKKYSSDRCKGGYKVEDIIVLDCYTYNYKEEKEINFTESLAFTVLKCGYKNGFYYFYTDTSEGKRIYVFDGSGKNIVSVNSFYISNDKLYYEEYTGKIKILNNNGDILSYNTDEFKVITIFNDKFIYLNNDKVLVVKNILNDEYIYTTNIKLENPIVLNNDNGVELLEVDYSVLDIEEFDKFRKTQNISDADIKDIKDALISEEDGNWIPYVVGYVIKLDKEGKFVSKDFYIGTN